MASIQKRACRFGKKLLQRIHPEDRAKWQEQLIEQSVQSRIMKWKYEFFFRTALSNTFTPSAILF